MGAKRKLASLVIGMCARVCVVYCRFLCALHSTTMRSIVKHPSLLSCTDFVTAHRQHMPVCGPACAVLCCDL
jgi:hypothetical protein